MSVPKSSEAFLLDLIDPDQYIGPLPKGTREAIADVLGRLARAEMLHASEALQAKPLAPKTAEEQYAVEHDEEMERKGRFAFDAGDDWRAE